MSVQVRALQHCSKGSLVPACLSTASALMRSSLPLRNWAVFDNILVCVQWPSPLITSAVVSISPPRVKTLFDSNPLTQQIERLNCVNSLTFYPHTYNVFTSTYSLTDFPLVWEKGVLPLLRVMLHAVHPTHSLSQNSGPCFANNPLPFPCLQTFL